MIISDKILNRDPLPYQISKVIDYFSGINLSIRNKILLSIFIAILLMAGINAMLMVQVLRFNHQYNAIITNITTANKLNGYIKPAVDTEMWNIVAGKTEFIDGNQYQIIEDVNSQLLSIKANTDSDKAKIKLDVILRTMNTLTRYIDKMGQQIAAGSRFSENEAILENIRGVSDVVEASVQDYMLFEVNRADENFRETQAGFVRWGITYVILLVVVVVFSMGAAWIISESIYIPIKKLHNVTTTITQNDLQALMSGDNANEIAELGMSFNIMIGKIQELLKSKIKEQENLKKAEFRTLQAQINPHFLYNTLDTIIWMSEAGKNEQVIDIVRALSSFFRITLSRGKDWITIGEEIQHTRSYLTIQKMRYRNILDYSITIDEQVNLNDTILKLTMQPLVENALYHGIKNKRNGGVIDISVRQQAQTTILEVKDDGVGFTPERLAQIKAEMNRAETDDPHIELKDNGFGLENVNKRIKLYYGKEYGLSITSEPQQGTQVTLLIPRIKQDEYV